MTVATVSYALNGKGSINDKTRELVKRTAREMGYVPNQSARQTSTGMSNEVAIVVPNVLSPYGEYCECAFHLLADAGMRATISISEFSAEREETIVQELIGGGVAGVLISPTQEFDSRDGRNSNLEKLKRNRIPFVCRTEQSAYSSVGIDYRSMGKMMGEKLRAGGKRTVSLAVSHPPPFYANVNETLAGLRESMGSDASVRLDYVKDDERSRSSAEYGSLVRQLLSADWYACHRKLFHQIYDDEANRPDAIVSPTETCIVGILNEARACGIAIPDELAFIAGARSAVTYLSSIDMTAIHVPQERIASDMVTQLLAAIRNNTSTATIRLKPEFYRGSTF
jgi:LacI family transcriptional regulator